MAGENSIFDGTVEAASSRQNSIGGLTIRTTAPSTGEGIEVTAFVRSVGPALVRNDLYVLSGYSGADDDLNGRIYLSRVDNASPGTNTNTAFWDLAGTRVDSIQTQAQLQTLITDHPAFRTFIEAGSAADVSANANQIGTNVTNIATNTSKVGITPTSLLGSTSVTVTPNADNTVFTLTAQVSADSLSAAQRYALYQVAGTGKAALTTVPTGYFAAYQVTFESVLYIYLFSRSNGTVTATLVTDTNDIPGTTIYTHNIN